MYPRAELTLLEHRKAILQARIALQRIELAGQLQGVTRPLVWIDGVRARWQGFPSVIRLLSGPLILIVQRLLERRVPVGGKVLAWLPVAVGGAVPAEDSSAPAARFAPLGRPGQLLRRITWGVASSWPRVTPSWLITLSSRQRSAPVISPCSSCR